MQAAPVAADRPAKTEWPTLVLAACIYGGWMALTFYAGRIAWWLLPLPGAWLIAWHMSLQHELIHGHPSRFEWLNDLIGSVPLGLWLPYERYKASHLGHHRGDNLTDPIEDPESHYVTAERYRQIGPGGRWLLRAGNTLLGRMIIGPARAIATFLEHDARALLTGDADVRRAWLLHLPGVVLVLAWLLLVCNLSLVRYATLFVYPGLSLVLIRSFAEHRAADEPGHRTAIVEHAPVLGLLFLFNNLHVVHHLRPGLAWYRIPAAYRMNRPALLRDNGGLVYRGYLDVARRYLVRQHDLPVHRTHGWTQGHNPMR
ncbi:fatty acid desaturase [Lichenicola cladoniae]|uniref:Fatty acid desaturase n=1 Tax=Lichenicola cladoniae TaxID=1484109 RepID=A0A6M8HUR9_9PROT|nr:fatty acid desaturase [Lichenicola cladoniae]NPD66232.1 fatty acid desaturase [Acetobacteraceae bacterium]QKE92088.1 fatty acid desaturase [Lichenicola cladoniae]